MITIAFEKEKRGRTSWEEHTKKSFGSLNDLKEWCLELLFYNRAKINRLLCNGDWNRIEFMDYDYLYYIHMIKQDEKIIFSDGYHTKTLNHCNDDVKQFMEELEYEYEHPKFNFG